MKKKLGKLTFGMLCLFLVVYIFYNIYNLVCYYIMLKEMNVLLYMFTDMEFSTTCHLIFTSLIGPVICWFVALIYTVIIGRNRKVNCFVYIITALAILINLLGSSLSGGLSPVLNIMFILILFAAFVSFILLCVFHKNQSMKKKMNITMISVYGCAFVYEIIYYIIEMVSLLVNKYYFDLANVVNSILYCGMIFISLIIGGLVLGYILFPEKYLKTEEQNGE